MGKYAVTFAISGTGYAEVEADSEDEARQMMESGEFSTEPEITDWDINKESFRGGWVEFTPT